MKSYYGDPPERPTQVFTVDLGTVNRSGWSPDDSRTFFSFKQVSEDEKVLGAYVVVVKDEDVYISRPLFNALRGRIISRMLWGDWVFMEYGAKREFVWLEDCDFVPRNLSGQRGSQLFQKQLFWSRRNQAVLNWLDTL